nr:EamA family transporter [Pseudomonas aeruginosa]
MPLKSVDISTAIALHQLSPLLVLVVSILLLGYSPSGIELLGIALVFVGVFFAVAIGKGPRRAAPGSGHGRGCTRTGQGWSRQSD